MANKIDSNVTGLSFAEESSIGVLPGTPVWRQLEPNSYSDFGGSITTVARNPINAARQRKKGTTTDLDATSGFNADLTQDLNFARLMQGFAFADAREKTSTAPLNGTAVTLTGVTAVSGYAAASGLSNFIVNSLVLASGFTNTANNGLKTVTTVSGTAVLATGLADEASPPAASNLVKVGHQFASADISFSLNGALCRMNSAAVNLTTFGFIPGEWIYVGGDTVGTTPTTNKGYARISVITSGYLEFDKTDWTPATETGTGKTVRIFFGTVIRSEDTAALIKRRTYQLERQLGSDANGVMSEYQVGATPNTVAVNLPMADKATIDMAFVAIDNEQRTGTVGVKGGTRITPVTVDAYNTSSDFSRIKLGLVDPTTSNPTALFGFATDLTININNNVSPDKALGRLGAFDTSAGQFTVDGKITAYFSDITAVQAVRNNSDATIDVIMAKNNAGMLFDLPLITLGDGRLQVEQDKAIMVPLDTMASMSKYGHTLLFQYFYYLPTAAM